MPTKQHIARQDPNGVKAIGWEGAADVVVVKQEMLISNTFTGTTSQSGIVSVPNGPISPLGRTLDYNGNLTYNYGISVVDAGNSAPYYLGNIDPSAGTIQVFSNAGLTASVNNTSVKVTYFYLAPLSATVNPDGTATPNANVQLTGSKVIDVSLQNAASATGNGTVLTVGAIKTVTVEVSGTSTSRTINFEGASTSGTFYSITGTKLLDLSTGTQTTGSGEVWQFDVTGLVSFRARISAIAGGNVSVIGKGVA